MEMFTYAHVKVIFNGNRMPVVRMPRVIPCRVSPDGKLDIPARKPRGSRLAKLMKEHGHDQ